MDIRPDAMGQDAWQALVAVLNVSLFRLGGADLTVGSLAAMLMAFLLLIVFSHWLRRWLITRAFSSSHIELGTRDSLATLIRYVVLGFGVTIIFQAAGIALSSLTVLVGALGVGVGFGLQNIFSNFISGLIVMFERPVKIGDHISVGGVEGDVIQIGARATTLLSAQHTRIIVPNQSLITGIVVNWELHAGLSSSIISLRLAGDHRLNEQTLLGILSSIPQVLKTPAPQLFVSGIQAGSHTLELHFWLAGAADDRQHATSMVNRALADAAADGHLVLVA